VNNFGHELDMDPKVWSSSIQNPWYPRRKRWSRKNARDSRTPKKIDRTSGGFSQGKLGTILFFKRHSP
jgi:hypothetical protein